MVEGLLLIDMYCPRSRMTDQRTLLAEDEFSYDVFQEAVNRDGLWNTLGSSRDNFRAFFCCHESIHPGNNDSCGETCKNGREFGPEWVGKVHGGEVMSLSVSGDYFELPIPGHVHLL